MSMINASNLLFSKTQQQVLGLLYCQPDTDYHTNEIIRLSHSGTGAVQRELTKLTNAGILTVKKVGNQKRYQANHASPLFTELRGIVLKTFGLGNVLKEALASLTEKIKIAFVYGSIAKQEENAQSDIDLMIISDTLTYAEIFKLLEPAEVQLSRKINPTFYTTIEWECRKKSGNNFIAQIIKQPKILLIGTEDEFNKFG